MSCYFCEDKSRKMLAYYDKKKKRYVYFHHVNVTHHIDCDRTNNVKENLVELCQLCHMRLHGKIYRRLIKVGKLKVKKKAKH